MISILYLNLRTVCSQDPEDVEAVMDSIQTESLTLWRMVLTLTQQMTGEQR
jgi:hypothetical protein